MTESITIKLRPMSKAPKDREIFALHKLTSGAPDHGNFHPIQWIERPWDKAHRPHWGMRWHADFSTSLDNYVGWFDPRDLDTKDKL